MRLIASKENWIEGAAVQQLEKTAPLPGMELAVGLPDLHPGKGSPVGPAFLSREILYPFFGGQGRLAALRSRWAQSVRAIIAEIQRFERVLDAERLAAMGVSQESICLLVHSGSRGLGEHILRAHTDRYGAGGLAAGTAEGELYLQRHDEAMRWARANRALIARLLLDRLHASGDDVLGTLGRTRCGAAGAGRAGVRAGAP